ncbi:uncharacterized protein LOC142330924 [Lycorma delicatula]|uniref:uncharacterized protein LOC142330924 n=1 Tax=Lycorma delicatula TaxID=130591 RepID=UPI003F515DCD
MRGWHQTHGGQNLVQSVIAFQSISDHLAILTINTQMFTIYAPTETSPDSAKDDFYVKIQQSWDSIPQTDVILLAGDFNTNTGADRTGWEQTMGYFGHGVINDNGLCLLSFTNTNNLVVGNSHFQLPQKYQVTW